MKSCPEGCAECCGLVPFTRSMLEQFKDKIVRLPVEYLKFTTDGLLLPVTVEYRCIFLTKDNKCNIYKDRPNICRIWGESQPCLVQDPNNKVALNIKEQVAFVLQSNGYRRAEVS